MKTADIKNALRTRFRSPEWALFFEVADATGIKQSRWADAVAMNMYPSRGLEVHGFEVKVSRSDWLSELKNPEKSAPVQRYCDRWWIVAPAGVILAGELPPTWGQYEAQPGGKLRQVIAAPKLEAQPVSRDFVAAMLRRVSVADEDIVKAAVEIEVERLRQNDRKHIEREIEQRTDRLRALQAKIDEIELISGVSIDHWGCNAKEIGQAVKAVLKSGVLQTYRGIEGVRNSAAAVVRQCEEAMGLFPRSDEKVTV